MGQRKAVSSYAFLLFALVAGCSGGKSISYHDYQSVEIGTPVSALQINQGQPYQINDLENGLQEYIYIERMPLAGSREHFRQYSFFVDENNLVVGKRVDDEYSPIVDIEKDH